jgi:hypothetical protein
LNRSSPACGVFPKEVAMPFEVATLAIELSLPKILRSC